jgi:hypothetical protein
LRKTIQYQCLIGNVRGNIIRRWLYVKTRYSKICFE